MIESDRRYLSTELVEHSCPEREYKIKNVSLDQTMILMLHGPLDSKMLSWKILPLEPKKLTLP